MRWLLVLLPFTLAVALVCAVSTDDSSCAKARLMTPIAGTPASYTNNLRSAYTFNSAGAPSGIADNSGTGLSVTIPVNNVFPDAVGEVEVDVTFNHPEWSDLRITLRNPLGVTVVLVDRLCYDSTRPPNEQFWGAIQGQTTFKFSDSTGASLWEETCGKHESAFYDSNIKYKPSATGGAVTFDFSIPDVSAITYPGFNRLDAFNGAGTNTANGNWVLNIADLGAGNSGTFISAQLRINNRKFTSPASFYQTASSSSPSTVTAMTNGVFTRTIVSPFVGPSGSQKIAGIKVDLGLTTTVGGAGGLNAVLTGPIGSAILFPADASSMNPDFLSNPGSHYTFWDAASTTLASVIATNAPGNIPTGDYSPSPGFLSTIANLNTGLAGTWSITITVAAGTTILVTDSTIHWYLVDDDVIDTTSCAPPGLPPFTVAQWFKVSNKDRFCAQDLLFNVNGLTPTGVISYYYSTAGSAATQCSSLVCMGSLSHGGGGASVSVTARTVPGFNVDDITYYFALHLSTVDSPGDESVTFTLSRQPCTCNSVTTIPSGMPISALVAPFDQPPIGTSSISTLLADWDRPFTCGSASGSGLEAKWYRWTYPGKCPREVLLDTCRTGTDFDTNIRLYTDCPAETSQPTCAATIIGNNDDNSTACSSGLSTRAKFLFIAQPNTDYWIAVSGSGGNRPFGATVGAAGNFVLRLDYTQFPFGICNDVTVDLQDNGPPFIATLNGLAAKLSVNSYDPVQGFNGNGVGATCPLSAVSVPHTATFSCNEIGANPISVQVTNEVGKSNLTSSYCTGTVKITDTGDINASPVVPPVCAPWVYQGPASATLNEGDALHPNSFFWNFSPNDVLIAGGFPPYNLYARYYGPTNNTISTVAVGLLADQVAPAAAAPTPHAKFDYVTAFGAAGNVAITPSETIFPDNLPDNEAIQAYLFATDFNGLTDNLEGDWNISITVNNVAPGSLSVFPAFPALMNAANPYITIDEGEPLFSPVFPAFYYRFTDPGTTYDMPYLLEVRWDAGSVPLTNNYTDFDFANTTSPVIDDTQSLEDNVQQGFNIFPDSPAGVTNCPGDGLIAFRITDKDSGVSQPLSFNIKIRDVAPQWIGIPQSDTFTVGQGAPLSSASPTIDSTVTFTDSEISPNCVAREQYQLSINWNYASNPSLFVPQGSLITPLDFNQAVFDLTNSLAFTYTVPGIYTVVVRVAQDSNSNLKDDFSFTVIVQSVPLFILNTPFWSNPQVNEGSSLNAGALGNAQFNGDATDPGPFKSFVNWFGIDTNTLDSSSWVAGPTGLTRLVSFSNLASPVYPDGPHTYLAKLKVNSTYQTSLPKTFVVTVNNVAPSSVSVSNIVLDEGSSIGAVSLSFFDPAGALDSPYRVDIRETANRLPGATFTVLSTGANVLQWNAIVPDEKRCPSGVCQFSATVTDKDGGVGSTSFTITVQNVGPVLVHPDGAEAVFVTSGAKLSAGYIVSWTDPGLEDVFTVSVKWSSASAPVPIDGSRINQRGRFAILPESPITYSADNTITVTVSDGVSASTKDLIVKIVDEPVTAVKFDPAFVEVSEGPSTFATVTLHFYDTNAVGTVTVDVDWYGNGTSVTTVTAGGSNFQYTATVTSAAGLFPNGPDNYLAKVTIKNNGNVLTVLYLPIHVLNAFPVIVLYDTSHLRDGPTVTPQTLLFTDNSLLDTHIAFIDWGDESEYAFGTLVEQAGVNTPGRVTFPAHTYCFEGQYTVRILLEDADLGPDAQATVQWIVNNDCNGGEKGECCRVALHLDDLDDINHPCRKPECTPGSGPGTGCSYSFIQEVPCDDRVFCTNPDTCVDGFCVGDEEAAFLMPCSDGNACTLFDYCAGSVCHSGSLKNCDDDYKCTDDSCNVATGECTHTHNFGICPILGPIPQNPVPSHSPEPSPAPSPLARSRTSTPDPERKESSAASSLVVGFGLLIALIFSFVL